MKKQSLLVSLAVLAPIVFSATSCGEEKTAGTLDNYDIVEVGKKENIPVAQVGFVIATDAFESYGQEEGYAYDDPDSFIFVGKNALSKKESELFAKKYSYTVDLEDEVASFNVNFDKYSTYCKRSKRGIDAFSFKVNQELGTKCYLGFVADVMEYKLTPKDATKGDITIYGFAGPLILTLIYLNV